MSDLLVAKNIHKSYNNGCEVLHVIKGVDLSAAKGEVLFITGPSGAGKSTLLNLLAGLDMPDEGTVTLDGMDLCELSDPALSEIRNKKIGFVFQFYHLLPEFSALENVMLPSMIARGHKARTAKKKAAGALDAVGLKGRGNHLPAELSGGEQQRVAIARSLVNEPDILFCDEPTGNLDSESARDIYGLLYGLNAEKRITMIIVSHERQYADRASRILEIKDGNLGDYMI